MGNENNKRYWQSFLKGVRELAKIVGGLTAIYFLIVVFYYIANPDRAIFGQSGWENLIAVIGFFSFTYGVYLSGKNAVLEIAEEEILKKQRENYELIIEALLRKNEELKTSSKLIS